MTELVPVKALSRYFHDSRQFCYVLTDLQGTCLYANPIFLQYFGDPLANPEDLLFTQFLQPGDFEKYTHAITEVVSGQGLPVVLDLEHGIEDRPVTIRWELQLVENGGGELGIIQYVGTAIQPNLITDKERYKAYELSDEALWRLELEVPVPVDASTDQLIQHCRLYGYIAECNDNMSRIYGGELVGQQLDAVMKLNNPRQLEYMKAFINNGFTIKNIETEDHDVNGRRMYFLTNMTGIVENGMLKRVWGTLHDITERKKAEEERQRSELFYRNLIGDSLDGILLADTNGIITFASTSVEKILGYRPEDLLQTPAFDYVHPDDLPAAQLAFENEVNMEPIIKFIDIRLKTKFGDWLYCNVRGHNMLYNPYVSRMVVYFHDDSRRKAVEDRLRESEQRFRQLIDNLQTGVLLQNERSEVLICNRAAHQLLGLTEEQLLGREPFDPEWQLKHEDGSDFIRSTQPVTTAIRTKQTVRDVVMGVYRPKAGDTVWLLVNAEPVLNENGGIIYIICSFTDITEQKRLAQELIEQEIQKQKLLTRATIDAQEKERREIGKELHDNISQHLTTTRLYLEVASDKSSGELQEMILHAEKQLSDIIVEIRNISQSLVPPTLGDIGLVESVEDICNSIKRVHTFRVEFDHDEFREEALQENMKLMLFRIIQEQVNNIIRHSGADRISLQLKSLCDNAVLSITDNGRGFDPQVAKKGLGLTNMANRAGLFNGKMDIISAPGAGCSIVVTLPLK